MRSTKTWSPISSVFSIELEGMVKACSVKVMMNSPVTSTMAMEAINSAVVSLGFSGFCRLCAGLGAVSRFRRAAVFTSFLGSSQIQLFLEIVASAACGSRLLHAVRNMRCQRRLLNM